MLAVGLSLAWTPVALGVPGPGTECGAEAPASGEHDPCEGRGGPGGFDFGFVVPLAGAVVLAGVVALGAAYFVLRRRAAPPLNPEPIDAQDWWTCRTCGRNNVVGSARCYACGAWQR